MLNYCFVNAEEELLHVIRVNNSTYEEYLTAVAKIQNINYTDGNDYSFLHEAICQGKADIAIDLMGRGIDVNLQTINGYTAAQLVAEREQWELLYEILKHKPDVNLKDWRYGTSLLYDVVFYNSEIRTRIAKDLIAMGANPYSQNIYGKSPLDLVVLSDNKDLIEVFQKVPKLPEAPEKFRIPKKSKGFFKLKISDYQKYICIENTTMGYLEDKISDYAKIRDGKKVQYSFQITQISDSTWIVISCPKKMDFYNYHNLMSYIYGLPEDIESPAQTICVAQHKADDRFSYYGVMNKQLWEERLVGRFQNGESFSIYLPEAGKKDGNAQAFGDVMPIKSICQYLSSCGFDEACLSKLADMPSKEITVEMAI